MSLPAQKCMRFLGLFPVEALCESTRDERAHQVNPQGPQLFLGSRPVRETWLVVEADITIVSISLQLSLLRKVESVVAENNVVRAFFLGGRRVAMGGRQRGPVIVELPPDPVARAGGEPAVDNELAAAIPGQLDNQPENDDPPANPVGANENAHAQRAAAVAAPPPPPPRPDPNEVHRNRHHHHQKRPTPYDLNKQIKKLKEQNKSLRDKNNEIEREQRERARFKELFAEETAKLAPERAPVPVHPFTVPPAYQSGAPAFHPMAPGYPYHQYQPIMQQPSLQMYRQSGQYFQYL
ncbi:hypothetical protein QAD02_000439 [Eretmocerus hayati]|uniref:Uncharacterized protein n=1 Tax=Eretmocerus hayati TaxID=131215 RepID=A0ACC2NHZ5_9HYME|nr:hypothetical protein QAD02_000439 [Eretmocerus hayati]